MNKKQKALIASAIPYPLGQPLSSIYVIPSGRLYKGPFKGNGFDHMILIGEDAFTETYYFINEGRETDVLATFHLSHIHSVDIPHRFGGAIRLCFSPIIAIRDVSMSSIVPFEIPAPSDKAPEMPDSASSK